MKEADDEMKAEAHKSYMDRKVELDRRPSAEKKEWS